jgi:hypothetical protein
MKIFFATFAWMFLALGFVFSLAGSILFGQNLAFPISLNSVYGSDSSIENINQGAVLSAETEILVNELLMNGHDARPLLVSNFLERHNSPLTPYDEYGYFFVDLADRNGIDFRLLPAIAMQESNLCKAIPPDSFNCLGLGVHERGTWHFDSYRDNFEAAAKILKKNYIDQGLTTPEQIMRKYTPKSNGSWANSVNQWMAEMRYNDRKLGRELKKDTSVLEFATPTNESE